MNSEDTLTVLYIQHKLRIYHKVEDCISAIIEPIATCPYVLGEKGNENTKLICQSVIISNICNDMGTYRREPV